ncbi:MAG: zinc finger MYND domain-containing protein [Bacteroidota bacterium]
MYQQHLKNKTFYTLTSIFFFMLSTLHIISASQKQYGAQEEMLRSTENMIGRLNNYSRVFCQLASAGEIQVDKKDVKALKKIDEMTQALNQSTLQLKHGADKMVDEPSSDFENNETIQKKRQQHTTLLHKAQKFLASCPALKKEALEEDSKQVENHEAACDTLEKLKPFLTETLVNSSEEKEFPANITNQEIEKLKHTLQHLNPASIQTDPGLRKIFQQDSVKEQNFDNLTQHHTENNTFDKKQRSKEKLPNPLPADFYDSESDNYDEKQLSEKLKSTFDKKLRQKAKKIDEILYKYSDNPHSEKQAQAIEKIIYAKPKRKGKKQTPQRIQKDNKKLIAYAFYKACEIKASCTTLQWLWDLLEKPVLDQQAKKVVAAGYEVYKKHPMGKHSACMTLWVAKNKPYIQIKPSPSEAMHVLNSIGPDQMHKLLPPAFAENNANMLQLLKPYAEDPKHLSSALICTIQDNDFDRFSILIEKAPHASVIQHGVDKELPIFSAITAYHRNKECFKLCLTNIENQGKDLKIISTLQDAIYPTIFHAAISFAIGSTPKLAYDMVKKYEFPIQQALNILQEENKRNFAHTKDNYIDFYRCSDEFMTPLLMKNIITKHKLLKIQRLCTVCGQHADQWCKECKAVRYCAKECQKKDWSMHKTKVLVDTTSGLPLLYYSVLHGNYPAVKSYTKFFDQSTSLTFCTTSSIDTIDNKYKIKKGLAEKTLEIKKYKETLYTKVPLCSALLTLLTEARKYWH